MTKNEFINEEEHYENQPRQQSLGFQKDLEQRIEQELNKYTTHLGKKWAKTGELNTETQYILENVYEHITGDEPTESFLDPIYKHSGDATPQEVTNFFLDAYNHFKTTEPIHQRSVPYLALASTIGRYATGHRGDNE